jgi:hypothetical protein
VYKSSHFASLGSCPAALQSFFAQLLFLPIRRLTARIVNSGTEAGEKRKRAWRKSQSPLVGQGEKHGIEVVRSACIFSTLINTAAKRGVI